MVLPSDPLKFPFLQHAQDLDLQGQFHLPNFVQEHRAAMGHLEAAYLGPDGMCESAFFMPEELGFQQFAGDGPAVDGHEGLVRPRAVAVQGADQEFLAGTGLPRDQNGAVRRGHFGEDPKYLLQGGTLSNYSTRIKCHGLSWNGNGFQRCSDTA